MCLKKEETVSVVALAVLIVGLYLLLHQGVFSSSAVGAVIPGTLITAALGVLLWGWRSRIEQWFKTPDESKEKIRQKEELDLLIKPLYCEFDKYRGKPEDLGGTASPL